MLVPCHGHATGFEELLEVWGLNRCPSVHVSSGKKTLSAISAIHLIT